MRKLVGALVGAVALGAVAVAPASAQTNWSGLYFGGHGGWAWSDATWQFTNSPYVTTGGAVPANTPVGFDLDGFIGGGQIGLQHQFGNWVLGAELSMSGGDLDQQRKSPFYPAGFAGNAIGEDMRHKMSWLTTGHRPARLHAGGSRSPTSKAASPAPSSSPTTTTTSRRPSWPARASVTAAGRWAPASSIG